MVDTTETFQQTRFSVHWSVLCPPFSGAHSCQTMHHSTRWGQGGEVAKNGLAQERTWAIRGCLHPKPYLSVTLQLKGVKAASRCYRNWHPALAWTFFLQCYCTASLQPPGELEGQGKHDSKESVIQDTRRQQCSESLEGMNHTCKGDEVP